MTANHKDVQRRSFVYCSETCPDVDMAFERAEAEMAHLIADALISDFSTFMGRLCAAVKDVGTENMRDALNSACSDLLEAEIRLETAEGRIGELESELEELRNQLQ